MNTAFNFMKQTKVKNNLKGDFKMEYLQKAIEDIQNDWFKNHVIKNIEGKDGFQRISFGEKGTRMYQVDYVLSNNVVFVTGDLGEATYVLTCEATLDNIKNFDLSYFTGKLTAHEKRRWDFDATLARSKMNEYIFDVCDVDSANDLNKVEKELYDDLIAATMEWDLQQHFEMALFSIYNHSNVEWFDGETASMVSDLGKRLPRSYIAYWVGLQMIAKELGLTKKSMLENLKGEDNMYVSQLDKETQDNIRNVVEKAIIETGIYDEEEVQNLVEDAMNSKLADLSDTIDIKKHLK